MARAGAFKGRSPVWAALRPTRPVRATLFLTSGLINILTLTGSLFMMQVYDRVLGSQSVETLIGLSAIAVFAYVMQGVLDGYRARILLLLAEKFDAAISPKVNAANLMLMLRSTDGAAEAQRNVRHVEALRAFIGGSGPLAACDLPWLPIYLLVAYILHWSLALTIVVAAVFFMWLTYMTDRVSRRSGRKANEAAIVRGLQAEGTLRNAEVVHAMGMRSVLARRWQELNDQFLLANRKVTFSVTGYAITSKTSRMLLQSLVLGHGAFLAIKGQISAGAIIAASIMSTRALAPIDLAIGSWKPFVAARDAYRALDDLLRRAEPETKPFELPAPTQSLIVSDLVVGLPMGAPVAGVPQQPGRVVLHGVRMAVAAGQIACVMGPSASGKSSLGRALVGVWRQRAGTVTLDGAPIEQWSPDLLGPHVGYLPQDVQLFDGTIAENIARFQDDATDVKVRAAAVAAEFDKHVLSIGGYDRRVGPGGAHLSAGQRQRLGLARALYGDPFLVVLDEPNSNLDAEGEAALLAALRGVKARGGIGIVIAHNLGVLAVADLVLYLDKGMPIVFGDRDKALAHLKLDMMNPNKPIRKPEGAAPAAAGQDAGTFQSPRLVLQRGGDKGSR